MAQPLFDPAALRLWRLAEELAKSVRGVRVLRARDAPPWSAAAGRWDESGGHQHAVPTVVACLSGVVRVDTAKKHIDLAAGELCVIAPAAWHAHVPLRSAAAQYGQGLLFGRSDVLLATASGSIAALISAEPSARLLRQLLDERDPARLRALAGELVGQFTTTAAEASQVHPAVLRMGQRIWSALHRPLDAAEVLAASGLSSRQAHRLFVSWFGAPPKRVIRAQQLALAAELLREEAGIGETARASGFPDRRAFTRAWRGQHGRPPRDQAAAR